MKKTLEEVLSEISAKKDESGKIKINRFSKKSFNELMLAMVNTPDFSFKTISGKPDELKEEDVKELFPTKEFRKFIKKVLQTAGVDKNESEKVLDASFEFESVDGLYEFFTAAMQTYLTVGNSYDLFQTEEFKGSIFMKDVEESVKVAEAFTPGTADERKSLGTFKTTKKKHKELCTKSPCPSFLKTRVPVDQSQVGK